MKKNLDWTQVLNDQNRWSDRREFQAWFDQIAGRPTHLLEGTVEGFIEALGFMRRSVAYLHFQEPVDLLWLDTQLKTITLGLLHYQGAQEGAVGQLPRFRARVKGMIDSDLLRSLKDTLLIRFAEYIGDHMDGTAPRVVSRCEGIYRQSRIDQSASEATYSSEMEDRFRAEIPMLSQPGAAPDLHRCPNLFSGNIKTRYCSDECRFVTAQLAKELDVADLLDAKPRRFRRSAKQAKNV